MKSTPELELCKKDGKEYNIKEKTKPRAVYVFATSAFRSKEEFLNAATKNNDVAMRDFATRIRHWVSLPDLFTIPEQKMLVAYSMMEGASEDVKMYFAASAALDLSICSSRGIKIQKEKIKDINRASKGTIKKIFANSWSTYPEWIKNAIDQKAEGSPYNAG